MGFNFSALPGVLTKPKQAFKDLGPQTMKEGAILAALFSIVASAISGVVGGQMNVVGWVVGAVVAAIILVATGWLAAMLAKMVFHGSGNTRNTVGYLGYGSFLGVVSAIVGAVLGMMGLGMMGSVTPANAMAMAGGALGVAAIVGLVFFLWSLYINGAAVGTANGIRLIFGAISFFVAALIVGIVVGTILVMVLGMIGLGAMMGGAAAIAG